jgi:hypothetical protein
MRRSTHLAPLLLLTAASTAFALPPGVAPQLRGGANHHIGDDSFVAKFGRAPRDGDAESVRMKTHLQHVHDWLAARPATRPDLEPRRAQILAAFQHYIDKGTTPRNMDLPWRTPVFIDEEGTICAVGYLIESTEGRALPEKIAKSHRYDFIEDIAGAMPEVQQWVETSGFTIDEIERIQPAYTEPEVKRWRSWDLVKYRPKDGPSTRYGSGNFRGGNMTGQWQMFADATGDAHQHANELASGKEPDPAERVVIGQGVMKHGHGEWTSFYETGEKLAEGRYSHNEPEGRWKIYHRSGNLAAEGSFSAGTRVGPWRFYYDTPVAMLMAAGSFGEDGSVRGTWRHYDGDGKLLARSWRETPSQWDDTNYDMNGGEGSVLDVVPGADGVHHVVHQGTPGVDTDSYSFSLDLFEKGHEKLYIANLIGTETWYDASGAKLEHTAGGWTSSDCHWGAQRKEIAAAGDVARLDGVLSGAAMARATAAAKRERAGEQVDQDQKEDLSPVCTGAKIAVSAARAARLDELLASRDQIRSATPQTVRDLILDQEEDATPSQEHGQSEEEKAWAKAQKLERADLAHLLAGNMAMYIEWPHIDRRFEQVYETMPGRFSADWASFSDQMKDPDGGDRS